MSRRRRVSDAVERGSPGQLGGGISRRRRTSSAEPLGHRHGSLHPRMSHHKAIELDRCADPGFGRSSAPRRWSPSLMRSSSLVRFRCWCVFRATACGFQSGGSQQMIPQRTGLHPGFCRAHPGDLVPRVSPSPCSRLSTGRRRILPEPSFVPPLDEDSARPHPAVGRSRRVRERRPAAATASLPNLLARLHARGAERPPPSLGSQPLLSKRSGRTIRGERSRPANDRTLAVNETEHSI